MRTLREQYNIGPLKLILTLAGVLLLAVYMVMAQIFTARDGRMADEYIRAIPPRAFAQGWDTVHLLIAFACIVLGLVALLAGVTQTAGHLSGRPFYLLGAFSLLFGLNTWVLTEYAAKTLSPVIIYYVFWFSFFSYLLPFLFFVFTFLDERTQARIWPFIFFPSVYGLFCILSMPLPFVSMEIFDRWYTNSMIVIWNTVMVAGLLGIKQKRVSKAFRILAAFLILGQFALLFLVMLGLQNHHNYYKIFVVVVVVYLLFFLLYDITKQHWETKSHIQFLELRNQYVLENYSLMQEHRQELAKLEHEMNHQLFALEVLCREEKYSQLLQTLQEIQNNHESLPKREYSGNPIADAVLVQAISRAERLEFTPILEISALPPLSITDVHLVSLVFNLLENALDACDKISSEKNRMMKVKIRSNPPYMYVSVENSTAERVIVEKNKIVTSKTGEDVWKHGHGLKVIENIAKQYDGFFRFQQEGGIFKAEVAVKCIKVVKGNN